LEDNDKQESGDLYNDRAAFVENLTPDADSLECATEENNVVSRAQQ